ncbi:MAG: hypothetical protein H6Q10_2304 [Acidobacteria bacterium]|nr:hypothetical protein [Acidobacteriota bacterium]
MTTESGPHGGHFLILTAVFNDWESLNLLLRDLDGVLHERRVSAEVVVVDDGSSLSFDDVDFDLSPFTTWTSTSAPSRPSIKSASWS